MKFGDNVIKFTSPRTNQIAEIIGFVINKSSQFDFKIRYEDGFEDLVGKGEVKPIEMKTEQQGLINKYRIEKIDGSPVNPRAKYFVLRHDGHGELHHVRASRKALKVYADNIKLYLPELAEDIYELLDEYEEAEKLDV